MKGLRWTLVMTALAIAGCDGGPKSPDFVPETTVSDFRITGPAPATTELASQSVPVGATQDVRALATITVTVPPGYTGSPAPVTEDGKLVVKYTNQDVTTETSWSSSPESTATVDGNGRITGKAQGNATVTASYKGESDTLAVTVTSATLAGGSVECIRPESSAAPACPASDVYSRTPGIDVTFEAIGRFSDGQLYRIATPPHTLAWTSGTPAVAANSSPASSTFRTITVGSAEIEGEVTAGVTPLPNPASATATLNVTSANEFCDTQFPAGSEVTSQSGPLCLGCSFSDTTPSSITDVSLETFATLSIPLGLLTLSDISVIVESPTTIAAGSPVGFLLSRTSNDILAAQLLSSLSVTTLSRVGDNLVQNGDPATNSEALRLTLLGIRVPESPQFLLRTAATTEPYDAVRLTFNAGLLSLLADVNVNTACSRARPEAAAP